MPPTTNEDLLTTLLDYDENLAAWLRNTFLKAIERVLEGFVKNGGCNTNKGSQWSGTFVPSIQFRIFHPENLDISELLHIFTSLHSMMKTINTKKATGTLGKMVSEVNPVQLAKMRNRMLIAAKIADAMQAQHLNQKQFAKLMGKTESEISDWLSGDRNFTIDTLFDIG